MAEDIRLMGKSEKDFEREAGVLDLWMLQVRAADGEGKGRFGLAGEQFAFPSERAAEEWLEQNEADVVSALQPGWAVHIICVTADTRKQ